MLYMVMNQKSSGTVVEKQEKPTICGTKAADVLDKFLAGKQCESTEYFVAFATTMTSQRS